MSSNNQSSSGSSSLQQPPTLKPRSYSTTSGTSNSSFTKTPQSPIIVIENEQQLSSKSTNTTTGGGGNSGGGSLSISTSTNQQQQAPPPTRSSSHRRLPSSFLLPSTPTSANIPTNLNLLNNNNNNSTATPQSPLSSGTGSSSIANNSPFNTSSLMYHFNSTSSNSLLVNIGGSGSNNNGSLNATPKSPNSPTNASSGSGLSGAASRNIPQQLLQQQQQFTPPLIPPLVSFNAIFADQQQQQQNKMMTLSSSSLLNNYSNNNISGGSTTGLGGTTAQQQQQQQQQQQPISHHTVEYYHAHMAMFIKKKFEEEEEYLMYAYPNEISSPNIHIRSLKELRGTLHSVFGECNDIVDEQVRFCYLTPTGKSVSSSWWNSVTTTTAASSSNPTTNHQHQSSVDMNSNTSNSTANSPNQFTPSTSTTVVPSSTTNQNEPQQPSTTTGGGNAGASSVKSSVNEKSESLLEFLQESKKLDHLHSSTNNNNGTTGGTTGGSGTTSDLQQNVIQLRETIEKNKRPLIVTYKILKHYIFLLYLPIPTDYNYGNVMKSVYEQYVNELFEFLDFIYENVEDCISNISDYQAQLDTIFNRFFEMVFHERDFSFINSFEDGFVKFQPSFHISQTIDAELSNLETIMKEDCFNVGTCLIYKGLLQLSHLPKNITKQVIRYLTHFNIIHRAQDSPEMVIIEKVFIKEFSNPFDLLISSNYGNSNYGNSNYGNSNYGNSNYSSADNGYDYLLSVITQGEKVMCSVLYAKRYPQSYYEGDLYYVDEMRTCLLQFEKKGIFSQLRGQLKTSHSLANVYSIPTVSVIGANTESYRDSTSGLVGLGSFTSNNFYGFGLMNDNASPNSSNNSNNNSNSSSSSNSGSNSADSMTVMNGSGNVKHFVTQGSYNVLLGYVVHSNANGVILYHNSSNPSIASVFSLKCQVVRQVLHSKRRAALSNNNSGSSSSGTGGDNDVGDQIVEFGIHIDQKIPLPNNMIGHVGYWICGRMNDMLDEFYVCYEDSIPQDVVELSYRLYSRLYI